MIDASMLFSFPDQSESFVLGFEAGGIFARMEALEAILDYGFEEGFPVHTANMELIQRMCAARGYWLETMNPGVEGWTAARMSLAPQRGPTLTIVREHDDDRA